MCDYIKNLWSNKILYTKDIFFSTIITSNRDFDEWPSIFVNPLLGTAALDRLVHKGVQIIIEGSSYRLAEFKKSCTKTKKPWEKILPGGQKLVKNS